MSQNSKQKTGTEGEKTAADFLLKKGYEILYQNYRIGRIEIDIIAKDQDCIVFVEVKTRNSYFNNPELAVNKSKQKNMVQAAEIFLEDNNIKLPLRFDIIAIINQSSLTEIEHFEDAFYPFTAL